MLFQNATVFTGDQLLSGYDVLIENGQINAIGTDLLGATTEQVIDMNGDYLVPGFIDLQLYGGSEAFLNETPTPEAIRQIFDSHARNGTTTLLPTMHSDTLAQMQQAMAAIATVRDAMPLNVPGIHLEGPYFNPVKRGAHRAALVRTPAEGELEALFSTNADVIRILTAAPEILSDEQLALLGQLKHPNTLLSLGHSNATYQQATDAFNGAGASPVFTLATHLYNAMRGFESREPGSVGAIFDHPTVACSIIADGYHCAPAAIRMAHRLLGPDRLFMICDALFANPPRPTFALGDFIVSYEPGSGTPDEPLHGRYVNNEGKLGGTAITLADCVRYAVDTVDLPLTDVLRMASTTPARLIGLDDQIGHIKAGYVANLVHLDRSLTVKGVWIDGEALA
ncbi:N-acetylglucosamine-6-phosphate deacetylase [Fibrella sp. WM1]|uniref:N-acetylglucosamine-6-phosphate deacetylase n=1 Tax=Fibrella musci TaxID=3242485 RepID=UPI0035200A5A